MFHHTPVLCVLSLCVASGGRHLCVSAYNCTLCFISLCSEWWTTPLCFSIQLYFVFSLCVASGGRHLCVSPYNCTLCFISLCSEWWTTPLCFSIQLYFVFSLRVASGGDELPRFDPPGVQRAPVRRVRGGRGLPGAAARLSGAALRLRPLRAGRRSPAAAPRRRQQRRAVSSGATLRGIHTGCLQLYTLQTMHFYT